MYRCLYCTVESAQYSTYSLQSRYFAEYNRYGRSVGKRWSILMHCNYPLLGEPAYIRHKDGTDI